jgi:hypothetical protein
LNYYSSNNWPKKGVTEKLKAENQMEWFRRMNNIRSCTEEIVLRETVYKYFGRTDIIEAKDQHITSGVGNEFTNILKTAQAASDSMSEKQKEEIIENLKNKEDKMKSKTIRYSKIG